MGCDDDDDDAAEDETGTVGLAAGSRDAWLPPLLGLIGTEDEVDK